MIRNTKPFLAAALSAAILVPHTVAALQQTNPSKLKDAIVLCVECSQALVNNNKKVIDPNDTGVYPVIRNNRTVVPVRFISENMGANVSWNGKTNTVTIQKDRKTIELIINQKSMTIDGKKVALDVPAQLINNRTYLPLRAVAEAFGKEVFYDRGLIAISSSKSLLDASQDEQLIDSLLYQLSYYDSWWEDPSPSAFDSYSIPTRTTDSRINITGQLLNPLATEVEVWIFKDDSRDLERLTVRNGTVSGTIVLSHGQGSYTLLINEDGERVLETSVMNEDPQSSLKSREYTISTDRSLDGYVTLNADLSHLPQIQKVDILYQNVDNGIGDGIYGTPIKNGKLSVRVPLSYGRGNYSISIYELDEDNTGRIIRDFYVTNEKNTDFTLMPSSRVQSAHPQILALANEITKGHSTAIQKSRAIYNWITENIKYDHGMELNNAPGINHGIHQSNHIFVALQVRATQCMGYSWLNAALHRAVGIPAKVILTSTHPGDHAWNEVLVDGKWIIQDTTWGAEKGLRELYFNPSPEQFAKTHTKEEEATD